MGIPEIIVAIFFSLVILAMWIKFMVLDCDGDSKTKVSNNNPVVYQSYDQYQQDKQSPNQIRVTAFKGMIIEGDKNQIEAAIKQNPNVRYTQLNS